MATKQTAAQAATEEAAQAATEEAAQQTGAWERTREVLLPRPQGNEQKSEFVCVNGRTFQVPKGKRVQVPEPVAEVIDNMQRQQDEADRRSEALAAEL